MKAIPTIRILSECHKQKIHEAVITLLSHTGVIVKEPRALELFHDAGGKVNGEHVLIPADTLGQALENAPSTVRIFDREGEESMVLGADAVYFGAHGDTPEIIDLVTGAIRRYCLQDAGDMALLCDALENIDFVSQNGFAEDVSNPRAVTPLVFSRMMRNTTKPLGVGCYDVDSLRWVLEVSSTVRTDKKDLAERPFFYHYSEPTSPLTHSAPSLRRLMMAVEHGIPLVYTPMVMAGATGPVTLAGTIAQLLAETLSGVVLAQTIRPGAPCIIGGIPTPMDMATTICSYGAPEMVLMAAALTEMVRFLKLPMFGTAGCTDSTRADSQAACEATFSCLSAALSGAHLVHDVGLLYHAERVSADYFVLCDEIIAMVRSFTKGIDLRKDFLALDVIDQVGPTGHFLEEEHTLSHFRRVWQPGIFDRSIESNTVDKIEITERLRARAKDLLERHQPRHISSDADAELSKIEQRLLSM